MIATEKHATAPENQAALADASAADAKKPNASPAAPHTLPDWCVVMPGIADNEAPQPLADGRVALRLNLKNSPLARVGHIAKWDAAPMQTGVKFFPPTGKGIRVWALHVDSRVMSVSDGCGAVSLPHRLSNPTIFVGAGKEQVVVNYCPTGQPITGATGAAMRAGYGDIFFLQPGTVIGLAELVDL